VAHIGMVRHRSFQKNSVVHIGMGAPQKFSKTIGGA
jgi:hypothetical protein